MSLFHSQYECDGDLVLFQCTECGYVSMSLGWLHSHVESHWPLLEYAKWHTYGWYLYDYNKWMEYTDVVRVDDVGHIELEDVEGL